MSQEIQVVRPWDAASQHADWRSACVADLLRWRRSAAWGYRAAASGGSLAAEPTALAALALHTLGVSYAPLVAEALTWLAEQQHADGSVGVTEKLDQPAWTTALALLAWRQAGGVNDPAIRAAIRSAEHWLLDMRGEQIDPRATGFAYDTTLIGWPWVGGTNSWLEPTAYALLALRSADSSTPSARARCDAGRRLILNRAVPTGGWNYGNPQAFGNGLRAFADTTGLALCALAGGAHDPVIDNALDFLHDELPQVRAPLSLGWGLLGLQAWNAAPPEFENWLAEAATSLQEPERHPLHAAMLLLAGAPHFALETTGAPA